MKKIQGKSILVRVSGRFELARVALSVLSGDNSAIRMFVHIIKDCNFFIFGDRLLHVFKPLLLYFDFVILTRLSLGICSSLIVPLSVVGFCKFETTNYNMIYRFFLLVTYPAIQFQINSLFHTIKDIYISVRR